MFDPLARICSLMLIVAFSAAACASAQQCPHEDTNGPSVPSEARTLEGKLVFHDDIRGWFELKLDQPQCGQTSIQLISIDHGWPALEVLRGCHVRSKGTIDFSSTGYYSLDVFQDVREIEPLGACTKQPLFSDFSKARPDKSVNAYRVEMTVNYEPGDHPIVFRVSSAGKELHPWQAYASYFLTGGFVLYGYCGKGFAIDKVFGTPEANPSHFTEQGDPSDAAAFDPESAASAGQKVLHLGYTCTREH